MEFFKIMKLLNKKFYMILLVFVGLIFSGAIFISTYPSPGDILDKIEEFISNPKQCASSNSDFSKAAKSIAWDRSEEHTSELQSQSNLVCRLLLEKKKKKQTQLYY